MNLIRLLILIAIVWLVLHFIRQHRQARQKPAPKARIPGARMLRCDHCGLHIPEDEAIRDDQGNYCCTEHQRLEHERKG